MSTVQSDTRAMPAFILAKHLANKFGGDVRDHLCTYLGFTGGDHIFRDKSGRVWAVDLVTQCCVLCAGVIPSRWKHPPRLVA